MKCLTLILGIMLLATLVYGQTVPPNPAEPVPGDKVVLTPSVSSFKIQKGETKELAVVISNDNAKGTNVWIGVDLDFTAGVDTTPQRISAGFWCEADTPITLQKLTMTLPGFVSYVSGSANINGTACDATVSGTSLIINIPKVLAPTGEITLRWKVKGI